MYFRRLVIWPVTAVVFLAACILTGCRTAAELVLDDAAFRGDMVEAAARGEQFRIRPEDYPEISRLFSDDNPLYRQAAVLLAEQTNKSFFYPLIILAAMDAVPEVSRTARKVIARNPEEYRSDLSAFITGGTSVQRAGAAEILAETGTEDMVPLLTGLFANPDQEVRNQASLAVWKLAKRENPFLQDRLNSLNSLEQAAAVHSLGLYAHSDDLLFFTSLFSAENAILRREAQQAVLRQGEMALGILHRMALDKAQPYRGRLSALEVIQGMRSPYSLSTLIELLEDSNPDIVLKVRSILGTYGRESVNALGRLYETESADYRMYAVELLGNIPADSSIRILVSALDDPVPAVRRSALKYLKGFGEEAWPVLRALMDSSDESLRIAILGILRDEGDPWLLRKEPDTLNSFALAQLVIHSPYNVLEDYLKRIDASASAVEIVLSLRRAWEAAGEFQQLENRILSSNNSYIYAWRQREQALSASKKTLQQSFSVLHEYFQSSDPALLSRAEALRRESLKYENESNEWAKRMKAMDKNARVSGKKNLERYRILRNTLVKTWEYLTPEYKETAEKIYAESNLDPAILYSELSLAE